MEIRNCVWDLYVFCFVQGGIDHSPPFSTKVEMKVGRAIPLPLLCAYIGILQGDLDFVFLKCLWNWNVLQYKHITAFIKVSHSMRRLWDLYLHVLFLF